MSNQATRLRAVLDQLEHKQLNAQQAAAIVRTLHFPVPELKTAHDLLRDPDPPVDQPGSFAEVEQAFITGRIDAREYEILAQAAAETIDKGEHDTGSVSTE